METRKATRSGPHAQNGLVIWRARRRKGMTQVELAAAAGVSRIQMIKLENGMHLPRPKTRDRIESALGLPAGTVKCEEAASIRPVDPFRPRSGRSANGAGRAAKSGKAGAGEVAA